MFNLLHFAVNVLCLASQDAIEVMLSLSHWVSVCIDLTDVTLVSEDTYRDEEEDEEDEDDEDDEDDEEDKTYQVIMSILW